MSCEPTESSSVRNKNLRTLERPGSRTMASMTPDEIIDRFNPAKRPMALEGRDALELYIGQISHNLIALQAALESLNAAVAESKELLEAHTAEHAPDRDPATDPVGCRPKA